ncbi:MAG: SDR family NAD(P)-dependent oxidoreductase, partial [Limnobacter sp.]|nr:SDR family NAD(P)-dependent oxidoreductase [Limnobacter sp.]
MEGSVVVITGAAGHLGQVVAAELGMMGYKLMLVDLKQPPWEGDSDAVSIGNVDLTEPEHAKEVVAQTLEYFGRLDAVVNIAGGFIWQTQADSSLENWDSMYSMNVQTAVNMCHAALPSLVGQKKGSIVNIGAAAAHQAGEGMGAYAATKAAVLR